MDGGLGQAIDQLLSTDPGSLDDGELHGTVIELECLDSLCAAARARYVGEWDQRRLWSSDGSKSASARLARETRCAPETARLELRRARKLRTMPLTSKAFEHGDITADHVDVIARANRAPITEQFTDGETTLVDAARHEDDFDLFRTIVQQWAHAADDDACDDKAEKAYRGRWFRDNEILEGVHDVRASSIPSAGSSSPTSSTASNTSSGSTTGPRRAPNTATTPPKPTWRAPATNAAPTPRSRWPVAPPPPMPTLGRPGPCSASTSTTPPSPADSANWPTAPPSPWSAPRIPDSGSCKIR